MSIASSSLRQMNRPMLYQTSQNRFPRRPKGLEIDSTTDLQKTLKEILFTISNRSTASDRTKLNYLNLFVKLILQAKDNIENYGFSIEEILECLSVSLLCPSTEVRSGGMRAIRYILKTEEDVKLLNKLMLPFLIARCLDLLVMNDTERVEALKAMRRILVLSSDEFDISLARSLVALANGGAEERNRMLRSCLGTLCEFGVLNPELFIKSGGVGAITRNLLECHTPKIAETLCGVLLLLLDKPGTRNVANVDFHCVAAPYCDFHYRNSWKDKNRRDERELRFHASRRVLLTLLKSWSGMLHFCSPLNKIGLRALIETLYLDQLEVRKGVLDLLYDLFSLPQPEWTDELSVALSAIDPSEPHSSWRLNEGFVVAEGSSVLPHLAKTTPSPVEAHTTLLLYCFLENGLLKALTEVIATGDTFISVRATVFLGEILRLMQVLLPAECCNFSPALPWLLEYAATNKPQALGAITALQRLHKLLKKRPASYSLHLDYILKSGNFINSSSNSTKKQKAATRRKIKLPQFLLKLEDNGIKETGVLLNKDAYTWDWNLIKIILRGENNFHQDLLDSTHRSFIERLVEFFMPSSSRYSHMDLTLPKVSSAYTTVGIDLVDCLISSRDPEAVQLLLKLFMDILNHVMAISTSNSVHDCLFSPQHMTNTQCQSYFLFIGQLGTTEKGVNLLNSINMYTELEKLATTTNNDCYVKLIVASMNYSYPGPSRQLLTKILTCQNESSRLYATQFLLVLLRAGIPDFSAWGVKLLIKQLSDESKNVMLSAINVLHEACEITDCLETLITNKPDFVRLGERGTVLFVRLLVLPLGFDIVNKSEPLVEHIKKWDEHFNFRYVKIVEDDISDALTLHRSSDDGSYDRGFVKSANCKENYLPPHLYGQLSQHSVGFELIISHGSSLKMIETLKNGACQTDQEILNLKAAMWALAHLSTSKEGFKYLHFHEFFADLVNLAENCKVYSVRGTAYYALCLVATTQKGADALLEFSWATTRHDRHNLYPIIDEPNIELLATTRAETSHTHTYGDSSLAEEDSFLSTDTDSIDTSTDHNFLSVRSPTSPDGKMFSYHQRSLSETATFDMIKGDKKVSPRRGESESHGQDKPHLDHSYSRIYASARYNRYRDKVSTLGTIPSSPSCRIEDNSGKKIRRHSESCRRISTQSGMNSDHSLSFESSSSMRLKQQDILGYETLRSLRKPELPQNQGDFIDFSFNDSSSSFTKATKQRTKSRSKSENITNLSLMSLSSVKKYSVKGVLKIKKNAFLGVTLPLDLNVLFPEDCYIRRSLEVAHMTDQESNLQTSEENVSLKCSSLEYDFFNVKINQFLYHQTKSCLKCWKLDVQDPIPNPDYVMEVLKQVEELANPGWSKQVKQYLFDLKQKRPEVFKDLCLYSEICKMIADNHYRLLPRRMLQDLFQDVSYGDIYDHILKKTDLPRDQSDLAILGNEACISGSEPSSEIKTKSKAREVTDREIENKSGQDDFSESDKSDINRTSKSPNDIHKPESGDSSNVRTPGIKTLESLNLTYKENKFPIRSDKK